MKKLIFLLAFTIISTPLLAKIEVKQEIKTEKATYSCYHKKCERIDGEVEKDVKFNYISITTSNSGKSFSKKNYVCVTTENGADCKAV